MTMIDDDVEDDDDYDVEDDDDYDVEDDDDDDCDDAEGDHEQGTHSGDEMDEQEEGEGEDEDETSSDDDSFEGELVEEEVAVASLVLRSAGKRNMLNSHSDYDFNINTNKKYR